LFQIDLDKPILQFEFPYSQNQVKIKNLQNLQKYQYLYVISLELL